MPLSDTLKSTAKALRRIHCFTTVSKAVACLSLFFLALSAVNMAIPLTETTCTILGWVAIIIAIVALVIIRKTRIGLNLRAVGENPGTSDASGVNVTRYKYLATIVGSLITGLGGLYYLFDYNTGSMEYSLDSLGWIAVALVIFSIWNTGLAVFGSFVFAFFYQLPIPLSNIIKNEAINPLVSTLPYLITILVLITISLFNKKETQPPSALGLTYFREDR